MEASVSGIFFLSYFPSPRFRVRTKISAMGFADQGVKNILSEEEDGEDYPFPLTLKSRKDTDSGSTTAIPATNGSSA